MILSQQVYECMLILEPNRYARDAAGVQRRIGEMIEKCGGEVLVSRLWADQKLAYPIKGHKKGVYWVVYFRLASERQTELNRAAQLNNDVLRALVIKLDPRIAGVMVEHAQAEKPSGATPVDRPPRADQPVAGRPQTVPSDEEE